MYVIFPLEVLLDLPRETCLRQSSNRAISERQVCLSNIEQLERETEKENTIPRRPDCETTGEIIPRRPDRETVGEVIPRRPDRRVIRSKSDKLNSELNPPVCRRQQRQLSATLPKTNSGNSNCHVDMTSDRSALSRDLVAPACGDLLKSFNTATFKLVKTVSDFTMQLSQINEQYAEQVQVLIENYRKKNSELRNERPACSSTLFQAWETLLQEVEADSQTYADLASVYGRQVSRAVVERTFHRKIQSKKLFAHREQYEGLLIKQDEGLQKCYKTYCDTYRSHVSAPSNVTLSNYFNAHNAYVQQLRATNGMINEYDTTVLPLLMQELEQVHNDVTYIIVDGILQAADLVSRKASNQCQRYESLAELCKSATGRTDLTLLSKHAHQLQPPAGPAAAALPAVSWFVSPVDSKLQIPQDGSGPTTQLRDDLVLDRLASISLAGDLSAAKRQCLELELQQRQLQDIVEAKVRSQARNQESGLYNKSSELQEEISNKQYDLLLNRLQQAAASAQRDLLAAKTDSSLERSRERRSTSSERSNMKTKWLKAFRSLKSTGLPKDSGSEKNGDGGGGRGGDGPSASALPEGAHWFQEYTYKKITACDVCNQILRGHTRQGLKCRLCRLNVHGECQNNVARCQPRSRLLRRQKSTSELEARYMEGGEDSGGRGETPDPVYSLLKQAAAKRKEPSVPPCTPTIQEHTPDLEGSEGAAAELFSMGSGSDFRFSSAASSSSAPRRQLPSGARGLNPPPILQRGTSSSSAPSESSWIACDSPTRGSVKTPSRQNSVKPTSRHIFRRLSLRRWPRKNRGASSDGQTISDPNVPHSPRRRQRLHLRMKSMSLDSPESSDYVQQHQQQQQEPPQRPAASAPGSYHSSHSQSQQMPTLALSLLALNATRKRRRRHCTPHQASTSLDLSGLEGRCGADMVAQSAPCTRPTSPTAGYAPASPVHNRRLLSSHTARMSSLDLPDENEKSQSSASVSPCPSPQKPHRLLPTTLYVVLFNFKSRDEDELDLTAGAKLTVIDSTNPDWWKGKFLGQVGFFPSNYVTKLQPGERPLQVAHNLQLSDGQEGLKLLRDQIVIQIGDELDGMVMIRDGENKTGSCPLKYLIEV